MLCHALADWERLECGACRSAEMLEFRSLIPVAAISKSKVKPHGYVLSCGTENDFSEITQRIFLTRHYSSVFLKKGTFSW
jgi:hypothetical protein